MYTMDEEQIFKDVEHLPMSKVVAKWGMPRAKIREIHERLKPFFPRRPVRCKASSEWLRTRRLRELKEIVDRYNEEHGTDYVPMV